MHDGAKREQAYMASSQIRIENNEEKISNSSTPMENEKLEMQARRLRSDKKIELNFEMNEEMKRQEQSINFGTTVYHSQRSRVNTSTSGIGLGLNSLQN